LTKAEEFAGLENPLPLLTVIIWHKRHYQAFKYYLWLLGHPGQLLFWAEWLDTGAENEIIQNVSF